MNLFQLNLMYTDLDKHVDVAGGLSRIMKNKKIYTRLLGSFTADTHYDELREQYMSGNYEEAAKTAHIIKGVTANLSLPMAYDLVVIIEGRLKVGNSDVAAELAQLDGVIAKTVEYIGVVIQNIDDIEV